MKIDPEFQNLIDPLTKDEFNRLEQNILKDGLRSPLVVWKEKGILIDGHHRFKILKKHDLPIKAENKSFKNRDHAMIWMIDQQAGRRNATQEHKSYLIGKRYNLEKKIIKNETGKNQHSEVSGKTYHQPKTSVQIAAENGISEKTVRNHADYATGIDYIADQAPDPIKTKKEIFSGESDLTKTQVEKVGKAVRQNQPDPTAVLQEKKEPVVDFIAIQMATIAIAQLRRIPDEHPEKEKAFDMVTNYIEKRRRKCQK